MILDWIESTSTYVVRVPRDAQASAVIQSLMHEHGLDLSLRNSSPSEAVLYTREPYAAASFYDYATPVARAKLRDLVQAIEASRAPGTKATFKTPPGLALWPFQSASVEYALSRQNVLLGEEPGLGKTAEAIVLANEWDAKRILVICPANIRLQWMRKISEWSTHHKCMSPHVIMSSKNGVNPYAGWTICSYDLARVTKIGQQLVGLKADMLILDEAHYLKTIDSKRTRAILGGGEDRHFEAIAEGCEHVVALTGTPLPNRPREAYTLARGLCWDSIDWASEDGFRDRFNPSKRMESTDPNTGVTKVWIDERAGRHGELQNRLRANFMTRHLKREVMTQLKMPIYDLIEVEETRAIKQALAAESLLDIDPENLLGADATILGHVAEVRKQMGVAMAPLVADYVNMLLEGGEKKLVLFGWHIEVLDILCHRLAKHGIVRIDGRTSAKQKEFLVQKFITDPSIEVIIGNIQSMGIGVDGLQLVSNHALIAEASWTPGDNIQAFDRLDRGEQTRQVQGDIFVAPNSFAEKILASALRKGRVIHNVLDRRV